ncbi:MAG: MFS transporter [Rhizobiales bacterium]|nr:MFS transporter [Hyphomicrobiales bacterium]
MNAAISSEPDPLLIPILSASNFVIGMGAFIVIGLLNPIAEDLALTTAGAGWIMTIYALAYAVLSPLLISMSGHIGRRRVLAAGLGLFALANGLASIAPDDVTLNVARVLAAAGAGMFTPVSSAVAAGLSSPERRARSLAAVFFGLTLAQVAGVPAGSFVAYTFGWRSAFAIVAALAVPCLWLVWTRVPAGLSFQSVSLADLRQILRNGPVMLAVLFTTTFIAAIYIPYTYLAPLLSTQMGFERNGITLALLAFGFGAVAGNMVSGIAADRIGPFKTLLGLAIAQVALMPAFSALPLPEVVVLAVVFCWSVCGWSIMAAQQSRLITLAPQAASVVLSLNAAAIYVGAAIGSAIGGVVINVSGLTTLGIAGSMAALFAIGHIVVSNRISP